MVIEKYLFHHLQKTKDRNYTNFVKKSYHKMRRPLCVTSHSLCTTSLLILSLPWLPCVTCVQDVHFKLHGCVNSQDVYSSVFSHTRGCLYCAAQCARSNTCVAAMFQVDGWCAEFQNLMNVPQANDCTAGGTDAKVLVKPDRLRGLHSIGCLGC